MNGASPIRTVLHNRQSRWEALATELAEERPVALTVNGQHWLTFMCTPCDLDALAVGFLFNEGFIETPPEVADVRVCPTGENVDVWLRRAVERPPAWRRTAGCVGGATAAAPGPEAYRPPVAAGPLLAPADIRRLMGELFAGQRLYRASGGVHSSALSDGQALTVLVEDMGRHNTLDKLAGRCLLAGRVPAGSLLLTTGRISSEMAQKAARMGAPIVISRSAPSSLAVELADQWGLTLIGYARRDRFNLYTHPERIRPEAGWPVRALAELPAVVEVSHAVK